MRRCSHFTSSPSYYLPFITTESHRSLWDALNIVKRAAASTHIVAGGGAAEMEVMTHLRGISRTIDGKQQIVMETFAKSFEVIPRQLAENAGFDPTDILNKLRQKHFTDPVGGRWYGVDVVNEGICDTYETNVWEPVASNINAIMAATEAACLILSVDQTVRNPQAEQTQQQAARAHQRQGQKLSRAMGGSGMGGMMPGVKKMRGRGGR